MTVTPLTPWFADAAALARFRRRDLGRRPLVLPPRDDAWRAIAPGFAEARAMAASGLPFQVAAGRRYDRSADPRRLGRALAAGATVYLPLVHQVLPRLARLMVALRLALLGPFREERSFLFLVEGRGRQGMGLHHDGDVESFWVQLEGRRTVTVGPPVAPGAPADLPDRVAGSGGRGWWTADLEPGTLFHLPPRTPHRVVCRARSLAVSLTWGPADPREALAHVLGTVDAPARASLATPRALAAILRRMLREAAGPAGRRLAAGRAWAAAATEWDVVSGRVTAVPEASAERLWVQVPVLAGPVDRRRRRFPLWVAGGGEVWLPASVRRLAGRLALMPALPRASLDADAVRALLAHGVVGPRDLPLRIVPAAPAALDGWLFA
ncbi:MAG TPA: cupin domain-containing protein [Methylomirabilota bacterium]|nr:cupin domain-containing protein [Methylomirabilota bacterium]